VLKIFENVGAAAGGGVMPLLEPLLLELLDPELLPELDAFPELEPELDVLPELEPELDVPEPELLPVPLLDLPPLEPFPASATVPPLPDEPPLDELPGSLAAASSPEAPVAETALTLPPLGGGVSVVPPYGPPSGSSAPPHPEAMPAARTPESTTEQVDSFMVFSPRLCLQRLRAPSTPKTGTISALSHAGG
jgi:hypothetical protein